MRHQIIGLGLAEPFLDRSFDPHQTGAELIFRQFTDGAYATIAEVIDIVDLPAAIAKLNQDFDDSGDILVR